MLEMNGCACFCTAHIRRILACSRKPGPNSCWRPHHRIASHSYGFALPSFLGQGSRRQRDGSTARIKQLGAPYFLLLVAPGM